MSLSALAAAIAPQSPRIVHDGREEIHRGDQRPVLGQPEHRRVVPGGGVDEDPRILDLRQMAQDLRQIGGAELAGSAGAVGECGEPDAGGGPEVSAMLASGTG